MSWAHSHGEACRSCPNLKEVLEGQCLGSVKAVWSCVDGHRYIMDTQCATTTNPEYKNSHLITPGRDGELLSEEEEEMEEDREGQLNKNERLSTPAQSNPLEHKAQTQSSELAQWTCHSEGETQTVKEAELAHGWLFKYGIFTIFIFSVGGLKKILIVYLQTNSAIQALSFEGIRFLRPPS